VDASGVSELNRIDISGSGGEARVRYLDGDFQVISPGSFVRCAVTGAQIPLEDLRYWSVERQEAYVDAAASLMAHQRATEPSKTGN
jgi:hypothetical protein